MWTPHRFSCRISTLDTGLNKGKIWNLRLPPAYDLVRKCKISYPCACGRTCASAEAERTADTERLGSGRGCCHAFCFLQCQPTSCVSDLAEVLPVSHFDCLILAFCSFRIKSTGPRSRACAALTSITYVSGNLSINLRGSVTDNCAHLRESPTASISGSAIGLMKC